MVFRRIEINKPRDFWKEINIVRERRKSRKHEPLDDQELELKISFEYIKSSRTVQASDLADLIAQTPGDQLKSITLDYVNVQGDFSLVDDALSRSEHLKKISVDALHPDTPYEDLASLGVALAQAPLLEEVELRFDCDEDPSSHALKVINPIVQRKSNVLRSLIVYNFEAPLEDDEAGHEEFASFFAGCGTSTKLKNLELAPRNRGFSNQSMVTALPFLDHLEKISIAIAPKVNLVDLAQILKGNQCLQSLEIEIFDTELWGRGPSKEIVAAEMAAFHALLCDNYVLESLCVYHWPEEGKKTSKALKPLVKGIEFLLRLNSMGRANILELGQGDDTDSDFKFRWRYPGCTETKRKWMEIIAHEQSASNIYSLLRQNPNLCHAQVSNSSIVESGGASENNRACAKVPESINVSSCRKRSREEDSNMIDVPGQRIRRPSFFHQNLGTL